MNPSLVLMDTGYEPNGVVPVVTTVSVETAAPPTGTSSNPPLKMQDAPAGSPRQCGSANVPKYPPSLPSARIDWKLSPGVMVTESCGKEAATPTVAFGLGLLPYATAVSAPSVAYRARTRPVSKPGPREKEKLWFCWPAAKWRDAGI